MSTTTARHCVAAAMLVALTALTGCSGGIGKPDSGGGTANGRSSVDAARVAAAPSAATSDLGPRAAPGPGATRSTVRTPSVVKTGEIYLTSKGLSRVRADVDDVLAEVGGSVDDERTTNSKDGRVLKSTLVLRVPVATFERAREALERLVTLTSSTESAKDVTTEVIDVTERVQTLQNSLDRLQRFQRSARDVRDLIRFEDDIARRQSELQSLKAQQSYLADQAAMSTITLHLATTATHVAPRGALHDAGFLSGLEGGWRAFVGLVLVVLTVLGALVPFLLLGGLVGVPVWLALRRRRRRTTAPVTE